MKIDQSIKAVVLTIILLLLFGCNIQSDQKETKKPLISREEWNKMHDVEETTPWKTHYVQEEERRADSIKQLCNRYWKRVDSLNAIKVKFFEDEVVRPALKDTEVPEVNRDFLKAMLNELRQPWPEARKEPFYQRSLLPVFTLEWGRRSVVENSFYQYKLILDAKDELIVIDTLGTFHFPELFQELKSENDLKFFAFTDKGSVPVELQDFRYFINECDDWFSFELDKTNLRSDDRVMFLSKFPLDLEFTGAAEIDQIWESQYIYFCYDCVFKIEPRLVFAKLAGVEHIYFTYTDTFPLNTGYDYPQRALVMRMGDYIVDLWVEEVDLFGCSCL